MLPFLCRGLALIALLLFAALPLRAEEPADAARRLLAEADSATWFAMNDEGDLATFDIGFDRLAEAEAIIASLPEGAEREALETQAEQLWLDLRWQWEVAHDKLAGVFPLIRFYNTTLLFDPDALGSHELFDDPRDRAAEQAMQGILDLPLAGLPQRPQLDVVFAEFPPDREVESNALTLFNGSPNYFVHNGREVAEALADIDPSGAMAEAVGHGEITPEIAQHLMDAFGAERLMHLTLRRQTAFDDEWFFIADARVFGQEGGVTLSPTPTRVMGFGRDRTYQVWPLVFIHLALWAVAVAAHQLLRGGRFDATDLVVPSIGFVLGRIMPWLVLPALSQIRPDNGHFAAAGFWWPALAGVLLLFLPIVVLRILGRRLPVIAPYLTWDRGLESLALAVATGIAAWLAVPLFALRQEAGILAFLLAVPALLATEWLIARLLKGEFREGWVAPIAAIALALALAKAEADWIAAALALAFAGLLMRPRREGAAEEGEAVAEEEQRYLPLEVLPRLVEIAEPLAQNKVVWVALTGPSGSGKSAHAKAFIKVLREASGEETFLLLDGACQRLPDGSGVPFAPFQHCLQQHLKLKLDLDAEGEHAALYDVLLGPLAPLFSGRSPMTSERDLYAFVVKALRQQAKHARVVLLVEDAQWLDEASQGLLSYLESSMPAGSPGKLLVLLVGRQEGEDDPLAQLLPGTTQVTLVPPDLEQERLILQEGRGLSAEVAEWVMEWLGATRGQAVWPGMLTEVVDQLARSGALLPGPDGAVFAPDFDPDRPPVAESAVAEVKSALGRLPQTRDTLSIGACLGRQFPARLVADALSQSRKEVLRDLGALEHETGLVRDVLEEDDLFEFRSQRALDAVREALSIRLAGPLATDVPQSVRELHALCATALSKQAEDSLGWLLAAATHWFGAGRTYAAEATTWNLRAAERLAQLLRFDEAETFLEQARTAAGLCGRQEEAEGLALLLAAERAHVTGVGARAAAEAGLKRLDGDKTQDPALALAVARACYEAGRDGGPSLLDEAERLALDVAENADAQPLQHAQGLHLAGLALRFQPAERTRAVERLREAVSLAEAEGVEGEALLSQIANSLAMLVGETGDAGREEAEGLFKRSIEIKRRQAIPDRPGLARSYGGLGLLLLEGDETRLEEAADYLSQDLALAEEIGDLAGTSKARLWLALCALRRSENERAEALFAEVVTQDQSPADRISAEAGLLEVAAQRDDRAAFLARAQALAEAIGKQAIPRESRESLARALAWSAVEEDPAVRALRQRLEPVA